MGWLRSLSWFLLWAVAGLVGLFALVTIIPFGPLGLISVAVAVIAARIGRAWPEGLGLLVGVGALALITGVNNVGPPPACSQVDMATAPSCRGVPPAPFLLAGLVLVVGSVVPYVMARVRARN